MKKAGILRIHIDSTWGGWRVQMSRDLAPAADCLYRKTFERLGLPLASGAEDLHCTKEDASARYDWAEGIDVILQFESGGRATLQEKFLDFKRTTVTFEETKTSGAPGAWYYCTAQYYFTGYAREYLNPYVRGQSRTIRPSEARVLKFHDWILINLPTLRILDGQGLVPWGDPKQRTTENPLGLRYNGRDGRKSSFRFVGFNNVPSECIVARHGQQVDSMQMALC